eukprot:329214-Rhodomonas_salina.1
MSVPHIRSRIGRMIPEDAWEETILSGSSTFDGARLWKDLNEDEGKRTERLGTLESEGGESRASKNPPLPPRPLPPDGILCVELSSTAVMVCNELAAASAWSIIASAESTDRLGTAPLLPMSQHPALTLVLSHPLLSPSPPFLPRPLPVQRVLIPLPGMTAIFTHSATGSQ